MIAVCLLLTKPQALLHWIEGDKASALTFIKSSVKIKGDRLLLSESARGLAIQVPLKKQSSDISENPTGGWLGFFYATVMLAMLLVGLLALGATFAVFYTPFDPSALFAAFLSWSAIGIMMAYLVLAPRCSRYARPLAVIIFGLLTIVTFILLLSTFIYGYEDSPGFELFVKSFLLFLIACGTATSIYYLVSEKVRRIFIR